MPYVNVKVLDDDMSENVKGRIIAGVTAAVSEAIGRDPASVFVVIDEVPTVNWGVGGESVAVRRQRDQT